MVNIEYASILRPLPGESHCGDKACVKKFNDEILLCLIDVAGHGKHAEARAKECIQIFDEHAHEKLEDIMTYLNQGTEGKREFVIGISLINISSGLINYISIGNITCRIIGLQGYRFISRAGVVGSSKIKPKLQQYILNNQDILLMYSDGISNRFEKKDYPQIITDKIEDIPTNIINKFAKDTDDASCIALRYYHD